MHQPGRDVRIDVRSLGKSYGSVEALIDVTLNAKAGSVLAVLGHNGAGKSTLVDILATRSAPTSGEATVCGWDVTRFGRHIRRHIGMAGQFVGLDDSLSGRGNLILLARLLGASRKQAKERADELIALFDLTDAATRKVATYSGGMRRRLDLAASVLGRPDVLFLDEPSTGLDPMSRAALWWFIERLAADGTTVLLTTQYLEEADHLASDVVVLGAGRVVARGTPTQLKSSFGSRTATVTFADDTSMRRAIAVLGLAANPTADEARRTVTVPVTGAAGVTTLVRMLDAAGVFATDLTTAEPTLNDVYMTLHEHGWPAS
ncbi:ABC-2 type transport system ATP-binding protein [Herbihabitans rhizosphaerae]|uniref:ABC-2 type transport system ATP-binding protein n=1 Tax=Herbihabitans rhizosphaerae TaxID=1872711 RepID=A0A4Q7KFH8_9PSEU|nr:ATP-binding cassette domain-containing protein [Herbihabitans rhizosphaerae]RZS32632.1 ABC-2 type transport system ATP-binding protein [Herbihabitans rhizosphaerae]